MRSSHVGSVDRCPQLAAPVRALRAGSGRAVATAACSLSTTRSVQQRRRVAALGAAAAGNARLQQPQSALATLGSPPLLLHASSSPARRTGVVA